MSAREYWPPEVGDRGHVDADVVPGDDALGLDRHRDDPQRHPVQHVDERDDEPEAGIPRTPHPAQPEQHPCSYCFTTLADKAIPSRNSAMTTTTTIFMVILLGCPGDACSRPAGRMAWCAGGRPAAGPLLRRGRSGR